MHSGIRFRVVICGAGIGGLTAAVALSAYPDIDVEVYEGASELAEVGAGIGIFPRPWEIIQRLGLEKDLLQCSEVKPQEGPVTSFRYRKSDQNPGLEFYTLMTNGNLMLFHRADFQRALLRRLPKSCQTHCSKRLRSYTQRLPGSIELLFEDGSTTTCDVLIGADGLKSAVRRSFMNEKVTRARSEGRHAEVADFNASVDPVWCGTNAYRALIPAERLKSHAPDHPIFSRPTQYLGKNGYIIAYPISHGKMINFVAFTARPELEGAPFDGPWVFSTDCAEFAGLFSHWEPEAQDLIAASGSYLSSHCFIDRSTSERGRSPWVGGPYRKAPQLVYLGLRSPNRRRGGHTLWRRIKDQAQNIQDAYVLATLLGHPSTTRETLHRALHIFDVVRRPKALEVAEKSRRNGQLFMLQDQSFEALSKKAIQDTLSALSEEFTKTWEWAWTTSIDEDLQEALRLLQLVVHPVTASPSNTYTAAHFTSTHQMGKRRGGLSGLSQFVLDAFKQNPAAAPDDEKLSLKVEDFEGRRAKRQKVAPTEQDGEEGRVGQWVEKYDATGLVPYYTHASQVPEHLKKYFSQRNRYFSLYSTHPGCLLDEEGWFSVTPERVADQIAERCRCDTILDAFCGVGGNAIAFAKTCQRVIALDTSPTRLALARHNAQIYGVADRIEFILSDYLSFARAYLALPPTQSARRIDVVFLSPPWGGPSYLSGTPPSPTNIPNASVEQETHVEGHPLFSLASIQPIHGAELFTLTRQITPNVAYFLPRNTRLDEISDLLESEVGLYGGGGSKAGNNEPEHVEVEEEWMGSKLKALTCYFGGLVAGQEALF
ncbi:hypothetical protein D9615_006637 [Tricholomella constricta]|uniref:Trimethylguanosine synthase n=1 Tax=Tricholomella constricta TaxID=117010 RepID=A0A8H5HA04_9AGAR|nr:hypothetical protein D9615_006637 [Tricholomella constricta]